MIHLRSRFDTASKGRLRYFYEVITSLFAGVCPSFGGPFAAWMFHRPTGASPTTWRSRTIPFARALR